MIQGWDETLKRFHGLGVEPVPVLRRGQFDEPTVKSVLKGLDLEKQEGFVVRYTSFFSEGEMANLVAKYVRARHVQSDIHWTKAEIIKNSLRSKS